MIHQLLMGGGGFISEYPFSELASLVVLPNYPIVEGSPEGAWNTTGSYGKRSGGVAAHGTSGYLLSSPIQLPTPPYGIRMDWFPIGQNGVNDFSYQLGWEGTPSTTTAQVNASPGLYSVRVIVQGDGSALTSITGNSNEAPDNGGSGVSGLFFSPYTSSLAQANWIQILGTT